jgi:hypothetical protein
LPIWYVPGSNSWITSSPTAATTSIYTQMQAMQQGQTASGYGLAPISNQLWAANTTSTYASTQDGLQWQYIQTQQQQQAAYERYQFALQQPSGLGQLFTPRAPAIITHQEHERRDRALYERAVAQHDQQEQERLLREIERHGRLAADERRLVDERAQKAREEQQRQVAAKARAREFLVEHLTPPQRETFDRNGWFIVEGGKSKTKYRIRAVESMVANVDVLNARGSPLHRLCAHVRLGMVPLGDQLLSQKIMLELAEDDFLRTANRHAA